MNFDLYFNSNTHCVTHELKCLDESFHLLYTYIKIRLYNTLKRDFLKYETMYEVNIHNNNPSTQLLSSNYQFSLIGF